MKKIILLSVITLFALISCTKEGVFNPKKKLSKTYSQFIALGISGEKELQQIFEWDGKLLNAIKDKDGVIEQQFEYNSKKQLVKITNPESPNYYVSLSYNGSKIETQELYMDGKLFAKSEYTHSGNKITEMVISLDAALLFESPKKMTEKLSYFGIPKKMTEKLSSHAAKFPSSAQKASLPFISFYAVSLDWSGKNISKMTIRYSDEILSLLEGDNVSDWRTYVTYSYDKNENPYYGFFGVSGELPILEATSLSENNVTSEKFEDNEGDSEVDNYVYEYENKFPVKRTYVYDSYSFIDFYEYE
ncbi:MAG: hypothetical protein LBQ31_10965 [Bacteroidales bacterium]|jgi:hypothetical protein|nr:hypothetical protein [Bacteroidales bacterium]